MSAPLMKKISSLCLLAGGLLGAVAPATAQTVFAPTGAEWWFEWRGMIIPPTPYTHVRVAGDTTLGGYPARKLLVEEIYDTGTGYQVQSIRPWFVRTAGDDVFRWNPSTASYQLEYSFGRPIGDVWAVATCTGTLPLTLDSIQQQTVGGVALRQQFYGDHTQPNSAYLPVLERVGIAGTNVILFWEPWCGPSGEADAIFISYSDAALRIGSVPVLSRVEPLATAALHVAPNPSATGRFRLEGIAAEAVSYAVFDVQGRRVRSGQLTGDSEVNLAAEPAGLYLLRGEVDGRTFTRRLIRE